MSSETENRLREEIKKLKQELNKIIQEKQKIEDEKQKIEREFEREKQQIIEDKERIEKEFEEFKLKHAGTVDELKKAMHLKPNLPIKKLGLGAKQGHKSYTRHIPERIDSVEELILDNCPQCNNKLPEKNQEVRSRYKTDIEFVIKSVNTEYKVPRKYCRKCKKIVEPTIPDILPHARFGLKLMLFVMYLRIGLRLPVNKVQEFLKVMCNLNVSNGEIILIGHQLAKAFGPYYKSLENLLKSAKVKHSDTTSWRAEKKNYVAWVFVSAGIVLYKITRKGNSKIALKLFGNKQQEKFLVVDRHSIWRSLSIKAGFIPVMGLIPRSSAPVSLYFMI